MLVLQLWTKELFFLSFYCKYSFRFDEYAPKLRIRQSTMADTLTQEKIKKLIKEIFQKEFKNLHFKNQNDNPPSPTHTPPILPPQKTFFFF